MDETWNLQEQPQTEPITPEDFMSYPGELSAKAIQRLIALLSRPEKTKIPSNVFERLLENLEESKVSQWEYKNLVIGAFNYYKDLPEFNQSHYYSKFFLNYLIKNGEIDRIREFTLNYPIDYSVLINLINEWYGEHMMLIANKYDFPLNLKNSYLQDRTFVLNVLHWFVKIWRMDLARAFLIGNLKHLYSCPKFLTQIIQDIFQWDANFISYDIKETMSWFGQLLFHDNINNLLQDPSLKEIEKVELRWLNPVPKGMTRIQLKVIVTRNLYFSQENISEESVRQEILKLNQTRQTFKDVELFKERNILLLSNWEKFRDKIPRFWKKKLVDFFTEQEWIAYQFQPKEDDPVEWKKAKQEFIKAFIHTSPPLTFVFDGHWNALSIGITGNPLDSDWKEDLVEITPLELAELYKQRVEKYPIITSMDIAKRDIFFLSSCFGNNFLREFSAILLQQNITPPIMIVGSEYWQLETDQFNWVTLPTWIMLLELLRYSNSKKALTIGDIFDQDMNMPIWSPSIYIQTPNTSKFMQLTQKPGDILENWFALS
jgi:hypothetical protein